MRMVFLFLLLLLFSTTFGCDTTDSGTLLMQKGNKSNPQRLGNFYRLYQAKNNWVGPASAEEFRSFIEGLSANRLEMFGVDKNDIDSLFISERDGEEFQFRFKVKGAPMHQSPVVFEKTGQNGVRLVGFTSLPPQEVSDDAEYDMLWAGEFKSEKRAGPQQ